MLRSIQCCAILAFAIVLLVQQANAQDEIYEFDGVADMDPQPIDPTDWMTSENWDDGGADPLPPFGPAIPDFGTRVEVQTSTFGVNAPVIGPGDIAQAYGVRIGRAAGEGLLTMTGGSLDTANSCEASPFTCNRRIRVGAADVSLPEERMPGTFNLSGGVVTTDTLWIGSGSLGTMNMSGGEVNTRGDLSFDWTFDAGSVLNMTGGTINVGVSAFASTRSLRMYRQSQLNLEGGNILIHGFAGLGYSDASVTQTPNVSVNISGGLLEAGDFLRVEGSVLVEGGVLRANSFNEALSTGTVEINATGRVQFDNGQESVAAIQALVTSGVFTTTDASPLIVEVVSIDGTDFTQVSTIGGWLDGDFDGDNDVDGFDLLKWQRGETFEPLSPTDFNLWESNFGVNLGPLQGSVVANVPEPTTVVLAMLAGMVVVTRRRVS